MSSRRAIPAGLIDSGMASLASFVVGLYAVRVLDPAALGAYALFYSAFATLMTISARLVFLPAEILAAKGDPGQRLGVLTRSLRLGLGPAVIAATGIGLAVLAVPAGVDETVVLAIAATALPCTAISPVQDHVRKMLHIGGRSWKAAAVSTIQLIGVVGMLAGLGVMGVPSAWRPFGALTIANVASCVAGVVLWVRTGELQTDVSVRLRSLLRSGRWLLVAGTAPNLGGFIAAALVAHLAGPTVLGYAEGARILARPIAVLSVGLSAVLGPSLMRAGAVRDVTASRRLSRQYTLLLVSLGILYLLVAGFDWVGNPLARLVPTAYAVPWLAAASICVYIIDRVAGAGASLQIMGAAQERGLGIAEAVAGVGRTVSGATASVTGAFSIPLGFLVMGVVRMTWLQVMIRRLHRESPADVAHPPPAEGSGSQGA